jgi:MOSC domain-containing protein YiiM
MHRTLEQLDAAIDSIRSSPRDHGTLEWIVCRPAVNERAVVEVATLDLTAGLVGDTWNVRPCRHVPDHTPDPERQVTLINARAIAAVAGDRAGWSSAGDQLYVDLDLGVENLPPGTHVQIGEATLVVTEPPHLGCAKFSARFGSDALRWVNTPTGRALNLRGIHARIVAPGQVRCGDAVRKLGRDSPRAPQPV